MKIVFLSRYQKETERGAENFVNELAKRLSKRHSVDVFAGNKSDSLGDILRGKYDIVVPINGRLQSLKVSLARVRGNHKLLITGHSGRGWDDIWNIAVVPDVFVALTDSLAKWAKNWAWRSKVVKIPNGVDLSKFKPEGEKLYLNLERPIVLSVGTLSWYKHHERAIDAMGYLDKGSLLIVGDGEQRDWLEGRGKKMLRKRFKIQSFGYLDMPKVYRSCDLFTLPSWSREAFGIAYVEAMASGLAVVAPDDESRREIVGNGGLLVNVENPYQYAEAIKAALKRDWSKDARKQAERFSWDKITNDYEKVMLEILS